jgi:transposase-like protein
MPFDDVGMPQGKGGGKKATPFRTSKDARTLAWKVRRAFTDETAWEFVKRIRFRDNGGEPYCPACGSVRHSVIKSRPRVWSCGETQCRKQYSVTSGTIFHSRKLPFDLLLELVFRFAESAKGTSACELSISMETSYSAVWHNLMKLREAMSSRRDDVTLAGEIEMDAAWFGGTVRPKNLVEDRQKDENDRRKGDDYEKGRRALVVARQRKGNSVMFAADREGRDVALGVMRNLVDLADDTKVFTDAAPAYREVSAFADHLTVDHGVGFKVGGINTNQAESSFSRARRAEIGVYHRWFRTWLDFYGGEMCWREDARRTGNLEQAMDILALALEHPQSRHLKGYYQHYQLPKPRDRPEVRFGRVEGRRAPRGRPPAAAEAVPDAGPVEVREEQIFLGPTLPPRPPGH